MAVLAMMMLLAVCQSGAHADPGQALLLEVDGIIGPASSDFIIRGIEDAEVSGASLVIIRVNTPGGLDSSMRDIIRKILASAVPVATYVAPPGSRAASAGTYILYASHIAAMAPATNLGAATPVSLSPGGLGSPRKPADDNADDDEEKSDSAPKPATAMERKVVNDAVAYIKGLARMRGRNVDWAEKAVREAASLTAVEALDQGVIDVVAKDVDDLLTQIHGREVEVADNPKVLDTESLSVETVIPDWRSKLLGIITNPNVAYVLMLLGVYGLFFELSNPGSIFPGVTGAVCLLLALYAFQVLPVNYAGVALILLGIALMIGELFMPSFGAMGIGGGIAFIVGSLILMDTEVEAFQLSVPLIVTVTAVTALFVFTIITLAVRQRRQPVVSGREELIGSVGEAMDEFTGSGRIKIHGESWSARSAERIARGQQVKVTTIDGLTLVVEPLTKEN
jgi:membrane-bound serine protease (ClpP class)